MISPYVRRLVYQPGQRKRNGQINLNPAVSTKYIDAGRVRHGEIYSTVHCKVYRSNQSAFSCAGAEAAPQLNQPPLVARRGAGARIPPALSLSASLGTSTSSKFVPLPTRPRSPLADSADDVRLCAGGIIDPSLAPSTSYPRGGDTSPRCCRRAVPPATIAGP